MGFIFLLALGALGGSVWPDLSELLSREENETRPDAAPDDDIQEINQILDEVFAETPEIAAPVMEMAEDDHSYNIDLTEDDVIDGDLDAPISIPQDYVPEEDVVHIMLNEGDDHDYYIYLRSAESNPAMTEDTYVLVQRSYEEDVIRDTPLIALGDLDDPSLAVEFCVAGEPVDFATEDDGAKLWLHPDHETIGERFEGTTEADMIYGTDGDDEIWSTEDFRCTDYTEAGQYWESYTDDAPDILDGGAGDDILRFGLGDEVTGGEGSDTFRGHIGDGTSMTMGEFMDQLNNSAPAIITDFNPGEDVIALSLPKFYPGSDHPLSTQPTEDGSGTELLYDGVVIVRVEGAGDIRLTGPNADINVVPMIH